MAVQFLVEELSSFASFKRTLMDAATIAAESISSIVIRPLTFGKGCAINIFCTHLWKKMTTAKLKVSSLMTEMINCNEMKWKLSENLNSNWNIIISFIMSMKRKESLWRWNFSIKNSHILNSTVNHLIFMCSILQANYDFELVPRDEYFFIFVSNMHGEMPCGVYTSEAD